MNEAIKNKFWSVKAESTEDDDVIGHVYIYDNISSGESWWGDVVTPKAFRKDIEDLGDISELNVHIFSNGGDVFAGHTIYSILKQQKVSVNVYIEGCAASIATVVAMAGDNIYISKIAMMLVHNPMAGLLGYFNKDNLTSIINDLEKIREPMISAYLSHMDKDKDEITAIMDGEDGEGTWFSASEAIENGLADEYIPEESDEVQGAVACTGLDKYEWEGHTLDLSMYKNVPTLTKNRKEKEKMAKVRTQKSKAEESTKKTYEVTCPECGHKYEIEVDSDSEETVISTTCPECDYAFKWDTESGESVTEDDDENADGEGTNTEEDEDTKAHYNKGVKAERNRIAALQTIKDANPAYSNIVDDAIVKGKSFAATSKKVFEAMKADNTEKEGKAPNFINMQKKETTITGNIGSSPNSGYCETKSEEDMAVEGILSGMVRR